MAICTALGLTIVEELDMLADAWDRSDEMRQSHLPILREITYELGAR